MAVLKYSRQREAIKRYVSHCNTHPTADEVYQKVREDYPNISLGTVYRNLTLLSEQGDIQRMATKGADRFDGILTDHDHFICEECGKVVDIPKTTNEMEMAKRGILPGKVAHREVYYYGTCEDCLEIDSVLQNKHNISVD